jgi:hypothetical protein
MTIDPTDFKPQGRPSFEQVRTVWDAHPAPSSRVIAELMVGRGFRISYRTVARMHELNWQEPEKKPRPRTTERSKSVKRTNVREVGRALKVETEKVSAPTLAEAGAVASAINGGALKDVDYARIESRWNALGEMTGAQLDESEAKARKKLNIILMEEAARRAHIMVLIPKETSHIVDSMTEAAKLPIVGVELLPATSLNGDGAVVINGKAEPTNELADAIDKFLKEDA